MSGKRHKKGIWLDPRAKLFLILMCVLSSMFAPSLAYQFVLVMLIAVLGAFFGKWKYVIIPVLELRNVTLRYKKRTILHDIGLSAGKGEVIGVVGHNGAGKTTFSRALCGLHKDCDGQFLWESKPIERILEFRGPIAPITIKTNREDVKMVLPVRIKEADNGSDGG